MNPTTTDDPLWMRRALALAARGLGYVEPNPMVGCVLVRDGKLLGEGYHHRFGGPHAEINALASLPQADLAAGATAYVTLEPCCHTGKTPPCTTALIAARIARVVVATQDPFPRVDGGGLHILRQAGIQVDVGPLGGEAKELNEAYFKRLRTGMPWVIAKWAMTIDGKIATRTGSSQWITGTLARQAVHHLRGRVDAIIVGAGTVAADDPTLTARPPTIPGKAGVANPLVPRRATRIVFANRRLPSLSSRLVQTIDDAPLMIVTSAIASRGKSRLERLRSAGAEVWVVDDSQQPSDAVVALLGELGKRQMTNVLVEGGSNLLSSFMAADQIDEIHAHVATKIVGGDTAPGPIGGQGFANISDAPRFSLHASERLDDDLRIVSKRIRNGDAST